MASFNLVYINMRYDENSRLRVGAFSPQLKIGNPKYNVMQMKNLISSYDLDLYVFPELSITGYTCADLFLQSALYKNALVELENLLDFTNATSSIIVVGMPIRKDNQLFNCAVYIQGGKILGIVPKTYIPNYNEFYEKRWFASGDNRLSNEINLFDEIIPFTPNLLIRDVEKGMIIGTDICEDLWMPIPPSSYHTINGANIIVNLSASNETISKAAYRKNLVTMQSAKCICGYIYASAGIDESTTDVVFSGHKMIANNGTMLSDATYKEDAITAIIDLEKLENDRIRFNSFMGKIEQMESEKKMPYHMVDITIDKKYSDIDLGFVDAYPFVPSNANDRKKRCDEIFEIQALGLAQRMKKTNIYKLVIGISGGLDSTLALLVAAKAMEIANKPMTNIIGITMPGFGTTKRTLNNSIALMDALGITSKNISIVDACLQHLKDIEHPTDVYDITYENVQARERTQILMDVANQENALVVGTGDLSELALGWCTYNGDHMSMYAVNVSIPKTLVRYLVMSIAMDYSKNSENKEKGSLIATLLFSICDTPVSPELLPLDKDGNMVQKTEDSIGKYDLHDFFLYNMLRNGYSPTKIYELAKFAFSDIDESVIKNTLSTFYRRFFTQQFKRSCLPDGPKVGSVAVSPRGDLRMPSDASMELWLEEIDNL